ncbi:MerR family transcriptional regulator [Actinomadura scrupuli]|uniref:MerR family transcriptional regulator n=1 Tax=Actinomadura scrupuli TaxID=559629 RepID=UPI003D989DB4
MALSPLDDEHAPLYTVGQVASMLDVRQAFLRRIDDQRVVSPRRSPGGQRRYTRHEIGRVQQVVTMMGEGMTLPAIRRIVELEHQLAQITRERDELTRRLVEHRRQRGAADGPRRHPREGGRPDRSQDRSAGPDSRDGPGPRTERTP